MGSSLAGVVGGRTGGGFGWGRKSERVMSRR